ncbi:MAG TPA: N-acetyltransferase [Edaphobacter sp.]|jgi:ribosomal-protein-alanine N-acetyltransferase|nr:N-acetyltransferase [Edaphobacter sp.]
MTSGDEVVLREYRVTDLEGIVRLDETCFAEEFRFDRRSMKAYAEARNAVSLIAEKEGEVVGFVIEHIDRVAAERRAYVVTLDVAAEYRRRGLAGRMMQAVEMLAEAAGALRMELHVFTENEGAIRFYERRGYERIARRKRFYGAEELDAFEYRKKLVIL